MLGRMKAIFIIAPLIAACAADEAPSELTLEGVDDGKADSLNGKKLLFDSEALYFLEHPTSEDHDLLIRYIAGDKLTLVAPRFQIDSGDLQSPIQPHPYWQIHEVSITSSVGVRMGLVLLDDTYRPDPLICTLPNGGRLNAFRSVAIDFFNRQITLNDTTTVSLAACGITFENYRCRVRLMPVPLAWPSTLEESTLPFTVQYEQH
jgi:hypothetical protein